MNKHTPPPLHLEPRKDGDIEICEADGNILATAYGDDSDPLCWPVSANAALFSAAPELLSELRDFHDHAIDLGYHDCDGISGGCSVLAAIAKAEGRDA